jgi:hypothetical protein
MKIKQTSILKRRVKKMHSAEKESLDQAIKNIMSNPSIGGNEKRRPIRHTDSKTQAQ